MDRRTLLKLLPLILVVACSDEEETAEPTNDAVDDVTAGTVGYNSWDGLDSATENGQVVGAWSQEEWEELWRMAGQEPLDAIDPAIQMGVGIYLGTRRTSGYAVLIDGVSLDGDAIKIDWTERSPGIDEFVTQAFTSPWAVLLIDARANNIDAPVPASMD